MSETMSIELPEKVTIEKNYDSIEITRQWSRFRALTMAIVSAYWLYIGITKNIGVVDINFKALLLLVLGLAGAYVAIVCLLTSTHLTVSRKELEVRHKPLPWFGNKTIQASDIKQLYGKEKRGKNKMIYAVHLITHNGEDTRLLSGLDSREQALYIEQEVEKYLSIKNVSVHGELV
ncbi:hypothetical protein AADZ86_08910 [Colwelliaceae bacterium BS250]